MQMMIKDPVKDPRTAERKVAAEPEEANGTHVNLDLPHHFSMLAM